MPTLKTSRKSAVPYDDADFDYRRYWQERGYEHDAQVLAIKRLLDGKHFKQAIDVGGGYGRLCVVLEKYASQVSLIEPRQRQQLIAADFLAGHPAIQRLKMDPHKLTFSDGSIDLVSAIRVLYRLKDPVPLLREISRVLSNDGYAIIEVANYRRPINRAKQLLKHHSATIKPVDVVIKGQQEPTFVNHNPQTVISQLAQSGLKVERILSVANLRSAGLNKIMPRRALLAIEGMLQPVLSHGYVGPSIFFLVRKAR